MFVTVLATGVAWATPFPNPAPEPLPPAEVVYPEAIVSPDTPIDPPGSELTDRGRDLRGVYVPYPRLRSWGPRRLAGWVKSTGANAVIMDIKDDRGRVTFARDLPFAKGSPHGEVRRMDKLVRALQDSGIYVIGRLVCFKDNQLFRVAPAAALRDKHTRKVWRDRGGLAWSDPHSPIAHEHIASVARAAERLGFDEIQLDYVRFPVEASARRASYPNRRGNPARHEVIAALLARVDRELAIPLSIDVFGLTAYHIGDPEGLGQSLEHLAPHIDAISPMVYLANWPRRYWERPHPTKTYGVINGAVRRIRERLGDAIAVRPLLQAFKWRADNFGVPFIHNQISAVEAGGGDGHLFWNQNGNYQKVTVAWRGRPSAPVERSASNQVPSR